MRESDRERSFEVCKKRVRRKVRAREETTFLDVVAREHREIGDGELKVNER